ncbi:MAG: zinc-binding dehydrogenase family oxidoreductase [Myxococcaceae bacterium]|nr:zinc-binding dehydrogenase family oxidoreductase [Myxococcaceae bacterium]
MLESDKLSDVKPGSLAVTLLAQEMLLITMRAIELEHFDPNLAGLRLVERPRPEPQRGEVLVRVACAPVNPSDLMSISGTYLHRPELPFVPGIVGVGEVVGHRAGLLGALLKGRRVVMATSPGRDGTWAEYAVTSAALCVPLPKGLLDEDAVNLIANGATAIGLVETLRKGGHKAAVLTAAGGELGRMVNAMARSHGLTLVNVVRSESQLAVLRELGALHIVNSTDADFQHRLEMLVKQTRATGAIDAIAGDMTRSLMTALPRGSTVYVVGRLSGHPLCFDGLEFLIGRQLTLKGFDITSWLLSQCLPRRLQIANRARKLIDDGHRTRVQHRSSLEDGARNLAELTQHTTRGKTLIYPALRA